MFLYLSLCFSAYLVSVHLLSLVHTHVCLLLVLTRSRFVRPGSPVRLEADTQRAHQDPAAAA